MIMIIPGIFAVLLIVILVYDTKLANAKADKERMQNYTAGAMEERLHIENAMFNAMKTLIQEANASSGAQQPKKTVARKE